MLSDRKTPSPFLEEVKCQRSLQIFHVGKKEIIVTGFQDFLEQQHKFSAFS